VIRDDQLRHQLARAIEILRIQPSLDCIPGQGRSAAERTSNPADGNQPIAQGFDPPQGAVIGQALDDIVDFIIVDGPDADWIGKAGTDEIVGSNARAIGICMDH
jgi:hypothetical protein